MSETIRSNCEGWHWEDVTSDLKKVGISNVKMHSQIVDPFGMGYTDGEPFTISWKRNELLMITMRQDNATLTRLVDAFSKIVEYKPFCKYTDFGGMKTYEWAKEDAKERYIEISEDISKRNLVRLVK